MMSRVEMKKKVNYLHFSSVQWKNPASSITFYAYEIIKRECGFGRIFNNAWTNFHGIRKNLWKPFLLLFLLQSIAMWRGYKTKAHAVRIQYAGWSRKNFSFAITLFLILL